MPAIAAVVPSAAQRAAFLLLVIVLTGRPPSPLSQTTADG
jgi:hypothetical protein